MIWKVAAGVVGLALLVAGLAFQMWQGERAARLEVEAELSLCSARTASILRDMERDNEQDNRDLFDVPDGWMLKF